MNKMLVQEFADLPDEYKKQIPPLNEMFRVDPTPDCPTGTRGRVGVYEMFDMNVELEHAILDRKGEDELFSIVRKKGMLTMKEDAIIKAAQGIVPFEEVNALGGQFNLDDTEAVVTVPTPAPTVLGEDINVTPEDAEREAAAQEATDAELKV